MKRRRYLMLLPLLGCLTGCPQPSTSPAPTASPVAVTPDETAATPAEERIGYIVKTLDLASGKPGWTFAPPEPEMLLPSMVTVDESIFVHSGVAIYCVDGKTGQQVWRTPVDAGVAWLYAGGGAVYCASQKDKLTGLDAKTGKQMWQVPLAGQAVAHSSGVVGVVDSLTATFTAVEAKSGKTLWTSKPVENIAAASDTSFFLAATGEARALNAKDGKEIWRHPGLDPQTTTAEAYGSGIVVLRTWKGLRGLDAATGAEKWATKEWGSQLQVAGDSVMFSANPAGSNDGPFRAVCLALKDGREKWAVPDNQQDLYVAKDRVLIGQGKTTRPMGSAGVAAVNLADGKVLWRSDKLPSNIIRGCTPTSALFADYADYAAP